MDYNYGYEYYGELDPTAFVTVIIISLIAAIWSTICLAKIYVKAGKPWWAAIIPVYNIITLIEIVDLPTWNVALFFIPFANIYITFKVYIELAKKFEKGAGYGVGLVFIFPILGAILAFDNSKYEVSNNYQNSVEQNNMSPNPQAIQQENYCPNCGAKSAASNTYCPYCGSKK